MYALQWQGMHSRHGPKVGPFLKSAAAVRPFCRAGVLWKSFLSSAVVLRVDVCSQSNSAALAPSSTPLSED